METKDILLELRTKKGLSQEDLANHVFVTRQAVSRWENGETVPNTETLKLLSKEFNVTINTLLGSPEKLICQCCGMPLDDDCVGHDKEGFLNQDYCKWCYADGNYTYSNMDDLVNVCVKHLVNDGFTLEEAKKHMEKTLPKLKYWQNHNELNDGKFEELKKELILEINNLNIKDMPELTNLSALVGNYVNLEYTLPNGTKAKFLDDNVTYLGNQLESLTTKNKCFGILANVEFILICTYEENGENPELIMYKKR